MSCYDALIESIRYADIQWLQSASDQSWLHSVLYLLHFLLTVPVEPYLREKTLDLALSLAVSFTEVTMTVAEGPAFWKFLTNWMENGTMEEVYLLAEQWEDIGKILQLGTIPEWMSPLILNNTVYLTKRCKFETIKDAFASVDSDVMTTSRLRIVAAETLLQFIRIHIQSNQVFAFLQVFGSLLKSADLLERELFVYAMRAFAPALASLPTYVEDVVTSLFQMSADPLTTKATLLFLSEIGPVPPPLQTPVLNFIISQGLLTQAPPEYLLVRTALNCLQTFIHTLSLDFTQISHFCELTPTLLSEVPTAEAERWLGCLTTAVSTLPDTDKLPALQQVAGLAVLDGTQVTLNTDFRVITAVVKVARASQEHYDALAPFLLKTVHFAQLCIRNQVLIQPSCYFLKTLFAVFGDYFSEMFPEMAENMLNSASFADISLLEAFNSAIAALGRSEHCRTWLQLHIFQLFSQLTAVLTQTDDFELASYIFLIYKNAFWSNAADFTDLILEKVFLSCEFALNRLNSRNSQDAVIGLLLEIYTSPVDVERFTALLTYLLLEKLVVVNAHLQGKLAMLLVKVRCGYLTAYTLGLREVRERGCFRALSGAAYSIVEAQLLSGIYPNGQLRLVLAEISQVLGRRKGEECLFNLGLL